MTVAVREKKDVAVSSERDAAVIEKVLMNGDLSKLSPAQRLHYYNRTCESLGLNPFTRPFDYIELQGKLSLYAKKDCTEQLRKINDVSIISLEEKFTDDLYIVTATAKLPCGRTDVATGAVSLVGIKKDKSGQIVGTYPLIGDAKANAIMKAETKAKRRVTLSICGLGYLDESEIETIPNSKIVDVDVETGEIEEPKQIAPPAPKVELVTKEQAEALKDLYSRCPLNQQEATLKALKDENILGWSKVPASRFDELTAKLSAFISQSLIEAESGEANDEQLPF